MLEEVLERVNCDASVGDVIDWVDGLGFQCLGEVTVAEREGVWVKRPERPDLYLSYRYLSTGPFPAVYHSRRKESDG